MGYSSRRPHRMPPLSAKNRKWKLQFAQTHKNWTIRRLENIAWSDESQFLLDPSCLVSTVQAGCGGEMVWGIYSWHTLDPLVPIEHHLNATAYLSIVSDHVHPFMTTVYPSSDGYFQQNNAPCHKAQIISNWFHSLSSLYSNGLHIHQISIQKSTFGMWWNGRNLQQLCVDIMSIWTKISEECSPTACLIYATKN